MKNTPTSQKYRFLISSWAMAILTISTSLSMVAFGHGGLPGHKKDETSRFVAIEAATKEQRTTLQNLGLSIEVTYSDRAWGMAPPAIVAKITAAGFRVLANQDPIDAMDFPAKDERFHNYREATELLQRLES